MAEGGVAFEFPPELLERIADRAAELVLERQEQGEGWLRGADAIAAYIGCKRDRVYALSARNEIPVEHDGAALVARRGALDAWLRDGGGKRAGRKRP